MTRQPGDDDDIEALTPIGAFVTPSDMEGQAARTMAEEELRIGERAPPSALDAERAVIAGLLLDPAATEAVDAAGLQADDFYRPAHATLYQAVESLRARREPHDSIHVVDELLRMRQLDAVGGAAAVSQLEHLLPSAALVGPYARQVVEKAKLRRLLACATSIAESCYRQDKRPADIIDRAERAILEVDRAAEDVSAIDRSAIIRAMLARGGRPVDGLVPTGFLDLDKVIVGMKPGTLNLLAARPGMGKTLVALEVGERVADRFGPVGMWSMEMLGEELLERELAGEAKLPPSSWATLNRHEQGKLAGAAGVIESRPLHIVDKALPVTALISSIRRMHQRAGIVLAIVDYLGLVRATSRYAGDRTNEVGEVSSLLKGLATELRIPILALSQLNREVEKRTDKRPQLADLRDSGSLEQDAHVVMFLYRADYYAAKHEDEMTFEQRAKLDKVRGTVEVIVAKNRSGPTGMARLGLDLATSRVWDLAPREAA